MEKLVRKLDPSGTGRAVSLSAVGKLLGKPKDWAGKLAGKAKTKGKGEAGVEVG